MNTVKSVIFYYKYKKYIKIKFQQWPLVLTFTMILIRASRFTNRTNDTIYKKAILFSPLHFFDRN